MTRLSPERLAMAGALEAEGLTDAEIGERMGISANTAKQYRSKARCARGEAKRGRVLIRGTFRERFEARVDRNGPVPEHRPELGPCHLWTAGLFSEGYGHVHDTHGEIGRPRGEYKSNRVAWMLYQGPIPEGLIVRHKCDRPACVRIEHLELGTQAENMEDKYARGRAKRATSEESILSSQRARERLADRKAGLPLRPREIRCSHCRERGHRRPKCPNLKAKAA